MSSGTVPQSFKNAIIKPLIKDKNLDQNSLDNYRPISNLPFLSKTLERVVNTRIDEYLNTNNLFDEGQTAYSKYNSTETALISVQNHILENLDNGKATVLVMLDLSAAYDTIDHKIFIQRLVSHFGFTETALLWVKSYLENRKFKVVVSDQVSEEHKSDCGVL